MKHLLFAVLALFMLILCGCRSTSTESAPAAEVDSEYSAEIKLGDTVLKAIRDNDYKLFRKQIAADQVKDFSEADFNTSYKNMLKQFGEIKSVKFVTELRTPAVTNLVWMISFERKGSDGESIEQDMLFRLVTGKVDGRTRILSMGLI